MATSPFHRAHVEVWRNLPATRAFPTGSCLENPSPRFRRQCDHITSYITHVIIWRMYYGQNTASATKIHILPPANMYYHHSTCRVARAHILWQWCMYSGNRMCLCITTKHMLVRKHMYYRHGTWTMARLHRQWQEFMYYGNMTCTMESRNADEVHTRYK